MPTGYKVALALGLVAILGIFGYIAFTGDSDPQDPTQAEGDGAPYTGPSDNSLRSFSDVEDITENPDQYRDDSYITESRQNSLSETSDRVTDLSHHDGSGPSLTEQFRADEAAQDRVQISIVESTRVRDSNRADERSSSNTIDRNSADTTTTTVTTSTTEGREYKIKEGDVLWNIAVEQYGNGMRHKEIAAANPGLDPGNLTPGKTIFLPKLKPEQQPVRSQSNPISNVPAGAKIVQVKEGETLSHIAQREYGAARDYHLLVKANPNVNPEKLKVGDNIIVPAKDKRTVARVEKTVPNGYISHTIGRGETYYDIAEAYYGDKSKFRLIVDANPDLNPRKLRVGMKIILPEP